MTSDRDNKKTPRSEEDTPTAAVPAEETTPAKKAPAAKKAEETTPAKKARAAKKAPAKKAAAPRKGTAKKAGPPAAAPATLLTATPAAAAPATSSPTEPAVSPATEITSVASGPRGATASPPPASAAAPDVATVKDPVTTAGRTPESELRVIGVRLLNHPGFAPELLALAAVEALGPPARDWAGRLRSAYPDVSSDGLARLATRRFVRQAGAGGATAALAGLFAPLAELAAVLWTQANLVLHLAAAYGRDPVHPDRAVELLVLTQVHPDAESARSALAAARTADGPGEAAWPRAAEAAWRLAAPLAAQAGGWLALRLASRLLPGAAVLAAAAGDAAAAERLAARAIGAYRPARGS